MTEESNQSVHEIPPHTSTLDKYRKVWRSKKRSIKNEIMISLQNPHVDGQIIYAASLLLQKGFKFVLIKAAGNACTRATLIAEILKTRINKLHQINRIHDIEIEDIYDPIEEGLDQVRITKKVPILEIILTLDDPNAMLEAAPDKKSIAFIFEQQELQEKEDPQGPLIVTAEEIKIGYQLPKPEKELKPFDLEKLGRKKKRAPHGKWQSRGGREGGPRNKGDRTEKDGEGKGEKPERQGKRGQKDYEVDKEEKKEESGPPPGFISRGRRGTRRGRGRARGGRGRGRGGERRRSVDDWELDKRRRGGNGGGGGRGRRDDDNKEDPLEFANRRKLSDDENRRDRDQGRPRGGDGFRDEERKGGPGRAVRKSRGGRPVVGGDLRNNLNAKQSGGGKEFGGGYREEERGYREEERGYGFNRNRDYTNEGKGDRYSGATYKGGEREKPIAYTHNRSGIDRDRDEFDRGDDSGEGNRGRFRGRGRGARGYMTRRGGPPRGGVSGRVTFRGGFGSSFGGGTFHKRGGAGAQS